MRDFGKVTHRWWTGTTGKAIRAMPEDERHLVRAVGVYLLTGSMSNHIGLYYLPLPFIAHEVGTSLEGALKALRRLEELDFCRYDTESEVVWVIEMAREQVGETLAEKDNQRKGVIREWQNYSKCPFYLDFYRRYGGPYQLPSPDERKAAARSSEGASKGLPSKEIETESDTESDTETLSPLPPKGGEDGSASHPTVISGRVCPKRFIDHLPPVLQTPEFDAAWQSWRRHLFEIRKSGSLESRANTLAELAEMGPVRAIAAIRHSLAKGWTGIFEPKPALSAQAKSGKLTPEEMAARL